MGQNADLPLSFSGDGEDALLLVDGGAFEGAARFFRDISVAQNYPALRDGISSKFHSVSFGA